MMNTNRLLFLTILTFGFFFLIRFYLQSTATLEDQIKKIWDEKREMTAVKKYQESILKENKEREKKRIEKEREGK
jgi:hypothetical protein